MLRPLDESGTSVGRASTEEWAQPAGSSAVARGMLPRLLPRPEWLPEATAAQREKPCNAGLLDAPKRTRTSTRLSRTRPSTW
jgi:hypothetical protein